MCGIMKMGKWDLSLAEPKNYICTGLYVVGQNEIQIEMILT